MELLIVVATLAMAISLVRAERLPVVSNGPLLGRVFTMLYGIGSILVTDAWVMRFLVMTVALVITLALGYARFVRCAPPPPTTAGSGFAEAELLVKRPVTVSRVKLSALKGSVLGAWEDRRSERPRIMLGRARPVVA
jgi:hypothetical protein